MKGRQLQEPERVGAYRAVSVGSLALARLSGGGSPVVHSQYTGALNLFAGDGMVSVVPRETGRGPLNILLEAEQFAEVPPLVPGWRLPFTDGAFRLGGATVSFDQVPVYAPDPIFPSRMLGRQGVERNIVESSDEAKSGRFGGLGGLVNEISAEGPRDAPTSPLVRLAVGPARELASALAASDSIGVRRSALKLIGLGPGLTPSGDDFLCGFMVSYRLGVANGAGGAGAADLLRCVPASAKGRTTSLSIEYLDLAARGRANERVISLVEAIFTGSPSDSRAKTRDVVRMGDTSGTDIVAGALLGAAVACGGLPAC